MKLKTLNQVVAGSFLVCLLGAGLFLRPLSPSEPSSVPSDHIVFRGVPSDLEVWSVAKVGGTASESFLGSAYTPIPKSDIRALGDEFTLAFKRAEFESIKRDFSGMKSKALLSGETYPEGVPLNLEGGGLSTTLKMKLAERWLWLMMSILGFLASIVFFLKQGKVSDFAESLVSLEAKAGKDKFIGTKVKDYRITAHLGSGGWGSVYEAVPDKLVGTNKAEGQRVAVKFFSLTGFLDNPENRERFRIEGAALRELEHPNIVKFIEEGETEDELPENRIPYLVLSYVPGQPMDELLYEKKMVKIENTDLTLEERTYFTFPPEKIAKMLGPVVEALEYAHKKEIIHRDLKPANVKIDNDGSVVLLDFGLSRLSQSDYTKTNVAMGTAIYAAPEVTMDAKGADHRADQFSLGVMMYHMLTGFHPFGDDEKKLWEVVLTQTPPLPMGDSKPYLTEALQDVLFKMLAFDKEDRFDSVTEAFAEFKKSVSV